MKLVCERDALHGALSTAVARARRGDKIPILAHFMIEAGHDQISIAATDLSARVRATCAAEVAEAGSRCVHAERLSQLVVGMPAGGQIRMELKDSELHVRCGSSRYRLPTVDPADFPEPWEPSNPVEIELSSADAAALFGDTKSAVDRNGGRIMLEGGCCYQPAPGKVAVVATDGTRLIRRSIPGATISGRYIIPRDAMAEIVKLAKSDVKLILSDRFVTVEAGPVTFSSKLIEATYPDVERVIPPPRTQFILLDRLEMLGALRRLAAVENSKERVVMSWSEGEAFKMSSEGEGFGNEEIACECSVPAGTIAFASSILMETLEAISGDVIEIHPPDRSNDALRVIDPADPELVVISMGLRG